ncbi:MAG: FHIPEP family type III secretion protein [Polyangiales bacterium]
MPWKDAAALTDPWAAKSTARRWAGLAALRRWGAGYSPAWADGVLATLVVLIVGIMIVPLPTWGLDLLLATNLGLALLLLLVAISMADALALTAFPTILLVSTLYRLALNLSSTRLILANADAGQMIHAFGHFVVQDNYVVGAVIFVLLTLIQFVVIAKGAERVAEVGARFTLDAMPGKQMSIDADLRAGSLSPEAGRQARRALGRESQFYGAMDGAMKFVKGDAIAAVLITLVNIVAGLIIGTTQRDLSLLASVHTYGLLTIGDGLLSQIPALLISTAAGLVVTRVAEPEQARTLGQAIAAQTFRAPRPFGTAALFLAVLALIPGLPALPLGVLAVSTGLWALHLQRRRPGVARLASGAQGPEATARWRITWDGHAPVRLAAEVPATRTLDPPPIPSGAPGRSAAAAPAALRVVLGPPHPRTPTMGEAPSRDRPGLRRRTAADDALPAAALAAALGHMGQRLQRHFALPLPPLDLCVEPAAPAGHVQVEVQEIAVATATLPPDALWRGPVTTAMPAGWQALPATWALSQPLWQRKRDTAQATTPLPGAVAVGYPAQVAAVVQAALTPHLAPLLSLQQCQRLLEAQAATDPVLVQHLRAQGVEVARLTEVLRRLLQEGVSLRPLPQILEALAQAARSQESVDALTEAVRTALCAYLTQRWAPQGQIGVFMLDGELETLLQSSLAGPGQTALWALDPAAAAELCQHAAATLAGVHQPVLLVTEPSLRHPLWTLCRRDVPGLSVLKPSELEPAVRIEVRGYLDFPS